MRYMSAVIITGAVYFAMAPSLHAQTTAQGAEDLRVVDAKLCRAVRNRVVEDEDSSFAPNAKVFLWLRTSGGANSQITVTWKSGQYTHATVLSIGGSPWRTWASKTVRTSGEWAVTITDAKQAVLGEKRFRVR